MKFYLYGAFDRHNYGDLLFPMVMERLLKERYPKSEVFICALTDSDLSSFGALKTISAKKMMNSLDENSVLMLAGGDVIGCDWVSAYSYLLSRTASQMMEKYIARIAPNRTRSFISSRIGVKSYFPFTIPKKLLPQKTKVVYNSVGATSLSSLTDSELAVHKDMVEEADFFSVRDNFSRFLVEENSVSKKPVILSPDSVCMLSSVYTKDIIEEKTSEDIKKLVDKLSCYGGYFIFQVSGPRAIKHDVTFAKSLDKLYKESKIPILFLAIGNAAGHEDQLGIKSVLEHLSPETLHHVYENGNVFDTIYLLKNAACYLGTSLHGVITSIAYDTPRVGLLNVRKQINYMNAWDLEEMPRGVKPEEIPDAVKVAMEFPANQLKEVRDKCKFNYMNNFNVMTQCIEIEKVQIDSKKEKKFCAEHRSI